MATNMAGRLAAQEGQQIAARCILWSDEAGFHTGDFVNRHNCHYWAAHNPEVTVEKMQNRPKVTVWCGMTAARIIGAYLLRDNMNVERYLNTFTAIVDLNRSNFSIARTPLFQLKSAT